MHRALGLILALALVATACTSDTTTRPGTPTNPTSPATTTTTIPETTTTLPEVAGAEPALATLALGVYADSTPPGPLQASVGNFDETTRVAVVTSGEDVTLFVADPDWRMVGGWWPSLGIDVSLGEFPKIVAVIGSDARPGSDPLRAQGDSIHFVGLAEDGTTSVLGVPRDSWLPVPGHGNAKITSALAYGGPELFMQAFADATGIEFDGYLLTGFEGFVGLVGVLGGVQVDVPVDLSDKWSKAYLSAGPQLLSAENALAFARTRKTIAGGDFTRKKHGGLILIAAATMVQGMGPSAIPVLMDGSRGLYWTDLDAKEALLLAAAITRADLVNATNVVASGSVGTSSGGASIVRLDDAAYALFEDMRDGVLDNP